MFTAEKPQAAPQKQDAGSLPGASPLGSRAFSQAELRELVDAGCDWIWETDSQLRFSWLSDGFEAATGVPPSEVLGRFRFDFLNQVPQASVTAAAHLADLEARRPFRNFVYELNGANARCRWVAITGFPRFAADGSFLGYRGVGRNVTGVLSAMENMTAPAGEDGILVDDLQRTLDALEMGVILLDSTLHARIINRAFYDIWKLKPGQVKVGDHFRTLMEVNRHTGIYDVPDDAWEDYVASRVAEIEQGDVTARAFERLDGLTIMYSVTALSGGQRILCYYDITDIKKREGALRASMSEADLLRHTLDELPVMAFIKGEDLRVEYVNQAWTDVTGLTYEESIGRTDAELFNPADAEGYSRDDLHVLETGEQIEREERLQHRDGTVHQMITRKSRLKAADGRYRIVGSAMDVTELKEREQELEQAQRRAVLADRAKSEFLANMSHEIRTPMNGVLGMAELLAKSELNPKQKMFTDIIVKSGNALLTIINDILDFSKIDSGQLVLEQLPFNLAEAIEDVATLVSARAKEKDLEMIVRIEPVCQRIFRGDAGRFRQIVTNLVGNAVKFTDRGHVLIEVAGEDLGTATKLKVSVTDTGIGIPADKLAQVFDKFSQVDSSSTRRHEGTGLGLAITSRLVALMGGEIGVQSVEGQGSTFWFTATLENVGEPAGRKPPPLDVTGARVLVIDDNAVNRAILSELMQSWGFDSCAAESGAEGMRVLKAACALGLSVDCIVLDYQMPGMSGADVARDIRSMPVVANTPIVMLTSVDQSLSSSLCRDLGIDAHLIKPARASALLDALVTSIQKSRAERMEAVVAPTLPPAASVQPAAAPGPAPASATIHSPQSRIDILVAEDNEVNQLVFSQILAETPYTFRVVSNGQLAIEAFRKYGPRMILMDVSMPQMNGMEATAAIREAEGPGSRVPIVGVTAHALKGDREQCLKAGMDDYLPKPVSPRALLQKVEKWIGESAEQRAQGAG